MRGVLINHVSIINLNTDRNIYTAEESALVNYGYYSISYIGNDGYYGLFFVDAAYKDKNKYLNCGKTGY